MTFQHLFTDLGYNFSMIEERIAEWKKFYDSSSQHCPTLSNHPPSPTYSQSETIICEGNYQATTPNFRHVYPKYPALCYQPSSPTYSPDFSKWDSNAKEHIYSTSSPTYQATSPEYYFEDDFPLANSSSSSDYSTENSDPQCSTETSYEPMINDDSSTDSNENIDSDLSSDCTEME